MFIIHENLLKRDKFRSNKHLKKTVKKVFPNFILSIVETIVLYFTVQMLVEIKEHAMLNDKLWNIGRVCVKNS